MTKNPNKLPKKYQKILSSERPPSQFPHASKNSRAAQFAPFSALETFDDCIDKTTFILDIFK